MKRVLSVSLGSSARDKRSETSLLGEPIVLERRGTDGDMKRFAALLAEEDGKADAFGIGGADLWVVAGRRRYRFREIARLVSGVKQTPIVDGSGLKHTLERETVRRLEAEGQIAWEGKRVLLVSGVDRFGMAQALEAHGAQVTYGDLPFGVGVPLPVRSYRAVETLGRIILPVVTRLPFQWFYPTGPKQERRTPKFPRLFQEAEVIAGDWHYIRRFMPDRLPGRIVLTQTLRSADFDLLRSAGIARAITTTPEIDGETFATNVMEAALVAILGRRPEELDEGAYLDAIARLGWKPKTFDLKGAGVSSGFAPAV